MADQSSWWGMGQSPLITQDGTIDPRMGGLLTLGASLLAGSRNGKGIGQNLGGGLLDAMQSQQFLAQNNAQAKRWAMQEELQRQQLDERRQDRQAQQAAAARVTDQINQLPDGPEKQLALANPAAWSEAKAKSLFEPAKPPTSRTINQGGQEVTQEWTPQGGWTEIARGARWAPQQPTQAPETFTTLSPDEVKTLGLPEGSVVQRSSRGRLDQLGGSAAAGETWTALPPEEAQKRGYAPGTVVQVSSRGQERVAQNPKAPGMTVYGPDGQPMVQIGGSADPMVNRDAAKIDRAADLQFKTADDALTALETRLKDTGMAVLPGAEQQKTAATYRLVINELRKLTDSGALQKADLDYLQSIIQDPTALSAGPTAIGNMVGSMSTNSVGGTLDQIQTVRDYLTSVRKRTGEVYAQPQMQPKAPPAANAPAPPAVGAVEDGHRFKGGDPANPNSWEPVS